jgi:hypothetical protein
MPNSSDVIAGQDATATNYNNLRKDVYNATSGHNHDGTDTGGRHLADGSVNTAKLIMYAGDSVAVDGGDSAAKSSPFALDKVKQITLARAGEYRVKFTLRIVVGSGTAGGTINAQVYKGGVAVGTIQSHSIGVSAVGTYDSSVFSEDIAGWAQLNTCQIYMEWAQIGGGSALAYVVDFEVCSSGIERSSVDL